MRIANRIAGTFVIRGAAAGSSLVMAALVINLYSLEKFGELSFALLTVRIIAAFSLFSLDSLLLRTLLRCEGRDVGKLRLRLIRECTGLAEAVSLLAFICVLAMGALMTTLTGGEDFWLSMLVLSPIMLMQNSIASHASLLRERRRDALSQLVVAGIPSVLPILIVALAFLFGDPPRYLPEAAYLTASTIAAVTGMLVTGLVPLRNLGFGLSRLVKRRVRILSYSSAIHSANVMNHLSEWYGPALLSATNSFAVVGLFRVFQQFALAFQLVSVSVEIPFSTEIAKAHIARNLEKLWALLRRSQFIIGSGGLAIAAVLLATPEFAYELLKIDLEQNGGLFFLLIGLLVFRLFAGASQSALVLMDSAPKLVRASTISLVLSAVIQTSLIPFFGLTGATLALGAQNILLGWTAYYFVRQDLLARQAARNST